MNGDGWRRFDRFFGRGLAASLLLTYLQASVAFMLLAPPDHVVPPSAKRHAWFYIALLGLALAGVLARWSRLKGRSGWWGAFAALGPIGIVVVGCLPTVRITRGFPLDPPP